MKLNYILKFLLCISFTLSSAQSITPVSSNENLLVCNMPDIGEPSDLFIGARDRVKDILSGRQMPCATIEVTYSNFPTDIFGNPGSQQKAFQLAIDIWEALIDSPVTIRIDANWAPAAAGSLGGAAPTYFGALAGSTDNVIYPAALIDKLAGVDASPGNFDIFCTFNSNRGDWYFPNDDDGDGDISDQITPTGQFNFTSVVLHEIGHGLGIAGFGREQTNSSGTDVGSIRRPLSGNLPDPNGNDPSAIYTHPWDTFIDGRNIFGGEVSILNESNFPDPSDQMLAAFEQATQPLTCNSPTAIAENTSGVELRIEGALFNNSDGLTKFRNGSSYSHWDESTVNGTDFALMTPFLGPGETAYDPGDVTLGFMQDMGWTICGRVLGNNDFNLESVTVSPNPFTNSITIELPPQIANQEFNISIVDINGRIINNIDSEIRSGEITISNLNNLKNALYFLNIESTTSDLSITKKIIKR